MLFLFRGTIVIIVVLFVLSTKCTMVKKRHATIEDGFRQCLISKPQTTVGYCVGFGAMSRLQILDDEPEFDIVDGVTFTRDDQQPREAYNFVERDPSDFKAIINSVSHVFAKRSMRWDMGFLYPGLSLRMAPSVSTGGQLEFFLDPHREAINQHSLKEAGTARLLARQFLVPFLLGFKFNVISVVPLIFGFLALIAKKAVILSKIALVVTSALGLGSLLLGQGGNRYPPGGYGINNQGGFNQGFGGGGGNGGGGGGNPYNRYPEEELLYRESSLQTDDELRLHGNMNLQNVYQREDKSKGRNFAWNEAEKIKKI